MSNRASYIHVNPNLKIGSAHRAPVLNVRERQTVLDIRQLLNNANLATSSSQADVALSAAFRGLRELVLERRNKP